VKVRIDYRPSYSLAVIDLEPRETVQVETGAMVSMTANVEIETQMKGGLLNAVTRTILGGETLFVNNFTSKDRAGEITLAPSLPGDLHHMTLAGETVYIQSGSFLASSPQIELDAKWGGARTFFASEGLFLLRAAGAGDVLVSSYGAIHRVDVTPDRPYVVDTGHVVAFTHGVEFDVIRVGGWKSTMLSGEGLVCRFHGNGHLLMQTRSTQAFLSWLIPRLPKATGGRGDRGSILGDLLRG
jgi:uncharacterized protein (TIGR00266 family)